MSNDKFWIYDVSVLYKDGKYTKIIPTKDMTYAQQLNAITRLFIFLFIIILLLNNLNLLIYIPIIGIILIIFIYNTHKNNHSNLEGYKTHNDKNQQLEYNKEKCNHVNSTINFNKNNSLTAFNSDDEDIIDNIDDSFNHYLYMDTHNLYNIKQLQRIWYNIPQQDQIKFANWLYKPEKTCKEDQICVLNH